MINRGKTSSYSYVVLLIFTVVAAMVWYKGESEKSPQFIVSSSLFKGAESLSLVLNGKKIVVVKDESTLWGLKKEVIESKLVVSDPTFSGIRRTNDIISKSLEIHESTPVEQLISYLAEKPFLRKVGSAAHDGSKYELIFFSNNVKICNFFIGPLSFTGAEVYIKDIDSGNTYLVERGLYFLIEQIYSGG